jgi:hypothetical protein
MWIGNPSLPCWQAQGGLYEYQFAPADGAKSAPSAELERYVDMSKERFTCPCCGHRTFTEPPGSYEICSVCFWEDDVVQLLDPAYQGGANVLSLMDCQVNYQQFGACEDRFVKNVRPPEKDEPCDPEWRLALESDLHWARTPRDLTDDEYRRIETWYYWKRKTT